MTIETNRFITTRGIIVTGWILLIVLCMLVVGTTLYLMVKGEPVPTNLENWTSTVIGFLLEPS